MADIWPTIGILAVWIVCAWIYNKREQFKQKFEPQNSLEAENARLRSALAPIINHAAADDYAPPIKFSVEACREIKGEVDGTN